MLAFIDTNVWVYFFEGSDSERQLQAQNLIASRQSANTVISTQVLVEFGSAMRKYRVVPEQIEAAMRELCAYSVRQHEPAMILRAHALCVQHQLSWFDALIVQSALDARCALLYSQDMQAGQQFTGTHGVLTVVNPFA